MKLYLQTGDKKRDATKELTGSDDLFILTVPIIENLLKLIGPGYELLIVDETERAKYREQRATDPS